MSTPQIPLSHLYERSGLVRRQTIMDTVQALHLSAVSLGVTGERLKGHTLALFAIAEAIGGREEFLRYNKTLSTTTLKLRGNDDNN